VQTAPGPRPTIGFAIPAAGRVEATHYAAVFEAQRLVSISFQFFTERDYRRVYAGLKSVMGEPAIERESRVSGLRGPTVRKTRTGMGSGAGRPGLEYALGSA
jgi:hypothetical protein